MRRSLGINLSIYSRLAQKYLMSSGVSPWASIFATNSVTAFETSVILWRRVLLPFERTEVADDWECAPVKSIDVVALSSWRSALGSSSRSISKGGSSDSKEAVFDLRYGWTRRSTASISASSGNFLGDMLSERMLDCNWRSFRHLIDLVYRTFYLCEWEKPTSSSNLHSKGLSTCVSESGATLSGSALWPGE